MFEYVIRNPVTAVILTTGSLVLALGACSANDATTPTGTPLSRGEALVAKYECASCHQDSDGKTLAGRRKPIAGTAAGVVAYGPNLTPDVDTGIGSWTDEQVLTSLKSGKDDEGAQLCATMPSFSVLGDSSLKDIVAYLRSLPAAANKAPESVCPPLKTAGGGATDAGKD